VLTMGDDKIIPVKVAVRIRPISKKEKNEGCQTALEVVENEPQVYIPNTEKSFTYDFALGGQSTNEELYTTAVRNIVKQLFTGYNVTVLAYGQTGSGKTHSMGTAYNAEDDPILEGVIPRSVRDIFKHIAENEDTEFLVKVSFMELYNEQLFDLLSTKSRREDTMVDIREDGNKGIKIPGLTETPITSVEDTMMMLEKASEGRVTAATAMNARSSRSHAIFTLGVEAKPKSDPKAVTISKFHLVDLAGSERQKKTKAKGDRLKEGININMGLLSLGNVISALGEENRGANSHIPYRDSKLTRLLQDSLGGNSHTLMIACVSPADSNLEETVSTLRYADRARKIKNKPIVNKDPKAAELGRLRTQVQQLQLQLIGAAGGINVGGGEGSQASQEVLDENKRLEVENGKLTSALQAAMDDNAHMSEKLLMSEMANEKLKLKLTELSSQAEQAVEQLNTSADATFSQKDLVAKLKKKVDEVKDSQKHAEKTMMDHDISRFNPQISSEPSSPAGSPACNSPTQDPDQPDLGGASYALKQTELANQLAELNKVLVAKQELAGKMGDNDEKMAAMRKKYEDTLKSMETEIARLQKEKDELGQQQRAEGNSKISEQRRKRIQELEGKIASLNKQQQEQQRLLKLNSQNEAKIKKYAEEIMQMKQLKVKLIKQMKEENEKVRVWKAAKEKEVNQLKQKERRAQVAMSSMSQKHERRENVLKRKMEEANATTKRLKDALAKKEAVRKQKAPVGQAALTGAGERVRGWLSSEVELVVTAKEAEKSKVQLIKERKSMTEELNKLRQELRRTTTAQEREEAQARQEKLQSELDIRNAQISELQQQILGIEQDKEKESKVDRWTRLVTMVEAKLAVQYLFDQATDAMASAASKTTELRETTHQYEELREIRNELRDQVNRMKMNHEDEIVRLERDHEERILFLLRQLPGQEVPETKDVSLNQEISDVEMRLKFQAEEIAKMSVLHDQLLDKDREVEVLKEELKKGGSGGRVSLMPRLGPNSPVKKEQKKRVTIAVERVTEEEFFSSSEESSDEDESDSDSDPEWRKTPMFKRIKAERRSLGGPSLTKRKRGSDGASGEDDDEEEERPGSKKRSGNGSTPNQGCTCTTGCKTKRCSCRKAGPYCTALCKCVHAKCANREVPGADVSSAVETDKENASMDSDDDNDNTNKLLDSTFDLQKPAKLSFADSPNTPGSRSPLKPIFKTPVVATGRSSADMFAAESDVDATPTNRNTVKEGASFFTSPQF